MAEAASVLTSVVPCAELHALHMDRVLLRDLLQDLEREQERCMARAADCRLLASAAQTHLWREINGKEAEAYEEVGRGLGLLLEVYRRPS